jgi:hypothetical protein
VNLSDFNQIITSAGEAFIDQVDVQLPDNIITKVYIVALIPDHDDYFLEVVSITGQYVVADG